MRIVASLIAIHSLVACSKTEPPPAKPDVAAGITAPSASAENAGGSSFPDKIDPVEPKATPPPVSNVTALDGYPSATPAPDGAAIFTNTCATCHMADGYGVPNLQPQIVGSAWISANDPQLLLSLILRGSAILGDAAQAYANDMAPLEHLSDAEVAAVATYVRKRFAATPITEPVTPAQVALARSRPGLP